MTDTIHELPGVTIKAKTSLYSKLKRVCSRFKIYIIGGTVFVILLIANKFYQNFK